ncbi:hypothetical protein [Steroidobacter sp.]|uniref:hypothetical protein n=1 Tax=Steroidobacter sp. TaxID=1978227 RepID=UPI001A6471B8|nr:hypothetical protein [Steroidobacter sp.]MBL8267317.1 hypothetical protein [Steroidobacter sp.]
MRDYERDQDDMDDYELLPRHRSSGGGILESIVLLGALALIATPAIKGIARRYRVRHPLAAGDEQVDESLKETFPASDPPAARYVDIPANRR